MVARNILGTKHRFLRPSSVVLAGVRTIESSRFMERAMRIEPTSEAWEVLNFPIPFSSQGDARPLVSINRWASKAHPVRPNSNCRLSTVSAHMVNDAAQIVMRRPAPTIYLRRPRRPTSDRLAKTSPAGLQEFWRGGGKSE